MPNTPFNQKLNPKALSTIYTIATLVLAGVTILLIMFCPNVFWILWGIVIAWVLIRFLWNEFFYYFSKKEGF